MLGDRLFMTTLDAHLVALDMKTGGVLLDVELADYKNGYASTVAPLIVKDKVILGIAGGDYGMPRVHRRLRRADRQARVALLYHRRRPGTSRAAKRGRRIDA